MKKILIGIFALLALCSCGQKTIITVDGASKDTTIAVTISTKEDKAVSLAPSTAVSSGTANASGTSAASKR